MISLDSLQLPLLAAVLAAAFANAFGTLPEARTVAHPPVATALAVVADLAPDARLGARADRGDRAAPLRAVLVEPPSPRLAPGGMGPLAFASPAALEPLAAAARIPASRCLGCI